MCGPAPARPGPARFSTRATSRDIACRLAGTRSSSSSWPTATASAASRPRIGRRRSTSSTSSWSARPRREPWTRSAPAPMRSSTSASG
eukprot:6463941-Prymnesium_polylepis.2